MLRAYDCPGGTLGCCSVICLKPVNYLITTSNSFQKYFISISFLLPGISLDGCEYILFEVGYLDLVLMDHVRRSGHFRTHLGLLKPSLVFVDKCDCVTIYRFLYRFLASP